MFFLRVLMKSLHYFCPSGAEPNSPEEFEEKIHFALQLISLLSIYGISFTLSTMVVKSIDIRLLLTSILTASFLTHEAWSFYVFRAHPDLLLSFL